MDAVVYLHVVSYKLILYDVVQKQCRTNILSPVHALFD